MMAKKFFLLVCLLSVLILSVRPGPSSAQENQPEFRVTVNMVQLNVAVTDHKGNYITGLRPDNFEINEDGISQKIATFGEGDSPARKVLDVTASDGGGVSDPPATSLKKEEPRELPSSGLVGSLNSLDPTCLFSLTPAITCIAALSSRRMPSLISCAHSRA
jgi:hypothetical protein